MLLLFVLHWKELRSSRRGLALAFPKGSAPFTNTQYCGTPVLIAGLLLSNPQAGAYSLLAWWAPVLCLSLRWALLSLSGPPFWALKLGPWIPVQYLGLLYNRIPHPFSPVSQTPHCHALVTSWNIYHIQEVLFTLMSLAKVNESLVWELISYKEFTTGSIVYFTIICKSCATHLLYLQNVP